MPLIPIYYDTETTGISPQRDRVIEIAAYDPINKREFVHLVNPGQPIPAEATAVHNITDEMVKDAKTWAEIGPLFAEFCAGDTVLIAHNNDRFDIIFLQEEFKRNNLPFPEFKTLDTLVWARKYRPDLPRHSLQSLREVFCIEANNAHRAMDDVIILEKVFSYLTGDLDMDTIYALSQAKKTSQDKLTAMPFGKHAGKPFHTLPKDYVEWLSKSGAFDKPENIELKAALVEAGMLQ